MYLLTARAVGEGGPVDGSFIGGSQAWPVLTLIVKHSNLTAVFSYFKYKFRGQVKLKFIHLFNLY